MATCIATFQVYLQFSIPAEVKAYLMTEEQKSESGATEKPGFWWIKYGTFNYIDKNREEQRIQADDFDHDYKHATEVEFDSDSESTECKGAESDMYCDVHQDIHLLHDGDGGLYCDECDEESGYTE